MGNLKKLGEVVKKLLPLLLAQKTDEHQVAAKLSEAVSVLKNLSSSSTYRELVNTEEGGEDDDHDQLFRKSIPTWLLDVAHTVIKYDIGLRLSHLEFKTALQPINV